MGALMEQHQHWTDARKRLFGSPAPLAKLKHLRPVPLFAPPQKLEALELAFPRPRLIGLFLGPIVELDATGIPFPDQGPRPSWRAIAREVGRKHGVTLADLRSPRRDRPTVAARHEAFWRCRNETTMSLPQIGSKFGDRDHSTVMWGIKQHVKRMAEGTAL